MNTWGDDPGPQPPTCAEAVLFGGALFVLVYLLGMLVFAR